MAAGSPSVTKPSDKWISSLKTLLDSAWYSLETPESLRSHFVRTTMGDFLKCFCCCSCGAQFIVNRERSNYVCPACHNSRVRADDTFLTAMVSEEQLKSIRRSQQMQDENDQLKPFQLFFSVPCKICGQPITEWTEENVKVGIKGYGWGHVACWNTNEGRSTLIVNALRQMNLRQPKT